MSNICVLDSKFSSLIVDLFLWLHLIGSFLLYFPNTLLGPHHPTICGVCMRAACSSRVGKSMEFRIFIGKSPISGGASRSIRGDDSILPTASVGCFVKICHRRHLINFFFVQSHCLYILQLFVISLSK